jgi:hypothetical protein
MVVTVEEDEVAPGHWPKKKKSQCYHSIDQMRPTRVKRDDDEVGPIAQKFQIALPGPG